MIYTLIITSHCRCMQYQRSCNMLLHKDLRHKEMTFRSVPLCPLKSGFPAAGSRAIPDRTSNTQLAGSPRLRRHLPPARCGVGSARTPAQPGLDGSVPCSFVDCGRAEAQGVVPVHRRVPVAGGRAAAPGDVVPATAPGDPERGLGWTQRVSGGIWPVILWAVILGVPIVAAFRDVPQHII